MNKSDCAIKIVFAGGGTGGHIYPGIAVADELVRLAGTQGKSVKIFWIGNQSGMDKDIIEKNLSSEGGSIDSFYGIPCGKLRRYLSLKNFTDIFKIIAGFVKSLFILAKLRPDVLFSKGGFVSVPPCAAAKILHIPYYTHECDFTPGLATRINSGGAKSILLSYERTAGYLKPSLRSKCIVTGNPVRPIFYEDNSAKGLEFLKIEKKTKPVLLVLGGSLGARQINSLVKENIGWLKERFVVVHQTGAAFASEHPEIMLIDDDSYKPYSFIYKEMPYVIQSSDVVLSRSGANSLWECAVCGKPMVLVPLCGSGTRGDQVDNARFFEQKGCALVLAGPDADSAHLKKALEELSDENKRVECSKACLELCAKTSSAAIIAQTILGGI